MGISLQHLPESLTRVLKSSGPQLGPGKGKREENLNRNQQAAARQLSLAAYLMSYGGVYRDESTIRSNLPAYREVYDSSLEEGEDREKAADALRKQLARDVEALGRAGISVEVEGHREGRRYRLLQEGFSPVDLELSEEERAVLAGAVRALRHDFPYAGPLRLALANLVGSVSPEIEGEANAFSAALSSVRDEELAGRVGRLEEAVSRRKRVRFEYYSISSGETSEREIEPCALSLLEGTWYVTGWDTGRTAVRQFRVSRIRGHIVFSTKKDAGDFEVPPDFQRSLAGPRAPWQLQEPHTTARVRISEEAFRSARTAYKWAVSMDPPDDHGLVMVTWYSGERQLAGWILSLGGEAEALTPEPLVERTVEGLRRIRDDHSPARTVSLEEA